MADKKTAEQAAVVNDEYEDIYIPKEFKGDDECLIAVNNDTVLVRKGETVRIKKKFAEVVRNSMALKRQSEQFIGSMAI